MRKSPVPSAPSSPATAPSVGTVLAPGASPAGGPLAGAGTPPLWLPGSHFAVALACLVAGGAGLVWTAPELASGSFLSPRVTGITHLFTLGWITTSIMGALYQLLPVVLGQAVRWRALAVATLAAWVPGLALFVTALALPRPPLLLPGAALLALAVLLFLTNLGATLQAAPRRDVTWWALASAGFFLFLTMLVGAALATNLRIPFMGSGRLVALATHIHVALVGWVLMVVVGVAQRLLPMFLLSDEGPRRLGGLAVGLLTLGTLLLFGLHHASGRAPRLVPPALILAGGLCFLVQAGWFYRTRRRPALDAGLRGAAAGLVLLALGAGLGLRLLLGTFTPTLATAYVLTLVLGITLFVAGHHYKILPFLVWLHRFGPLAGRRPVPTVAELYSARAAGVATALLTVGAAGMAVSVILGAALPARAAAVLFAGGAALQALQLAGVARRRPS